MAAEPPSVYTFLDYIALGFVLVAVEEIVRGTWQRCMICLFFGAVFMAVARNLPRLKVTVRQWFIKSKEPSIPSRVQCKIDSGAWLYLAPTEIFQNPIVAEISNPGRILEQVVGRLRFESCNGTHLTVDPACWIVSSETIKGITTEHSRALVPKVWKL